MATLQSLTELTSSCLLLYLQLTMSRRLSLPQIVLLLVAQMAVLQYSLINSLRFDLFNRSIDQGRVSKSWETATVIPVYKGKRLKV